MTTPIRCLHCLDEGHVCEYHPDYLWGIKVEGHDGEACGGAGMPCPACCSPIPEDGTTSITVAFVPDWQRALPGKGAEERREESVSDDRRRNSRS